MQTGWKLIVLMSMAVLALTLFPGRSLGIAVDSGRLSLPESAERKLPSGKLLIRQTREIYKSKDLKMSSPLRKMLERFYKWLGEQIKRLARSLFKQKPKQSARIDWTAVIKFLSVPLILLTIGFVLFQLGTRLKRDIRETQTAARTTADSWRSLIRNALNTRDEYPREALHDLLQAVIRRFIGLGILPDDPTLTVREIERLLKSGAIIQEQYESFGAFRVVYESVYYGGRSVQPDEWNDILQKVGVIIGEAVA